MNKKQSSGDHQNGDVKSNIIGQALSRSKEILSTSSKFVANRTTLVTNRRPYKYSQKYLETTYKDLTSKKVNERALYQFFWKVFKRAFWSGLFAYIVWKIAWDIPEVKSALNLTGATNATGGGAWEVFFAVFGIVYAILVGMLIVEALSRYNDLQALIAQEACAISDIDDFLVYLEKGDKAKSDIKKHILEYTYYILGTEWGDMKKGYIKECDTPPSLVGLMKAICNIRTQKNVCKNAQKLMMDRVAEVTTYRTERIEKSGECIKAPMRILVAGLSIAIVTGIILLVVNPPWLHIWMVVVVAIALASLYECIIDLNQPFGTDSPYDLWFIETKPFEQLMNKMS